MAPGWSCGLKCVLGSAWGCQELGTSCSTRRAEISVARWHQSCLWVMTCGSSDLCPGVSVTWALSPVPVGAGSPAGGRAGPLGSWRCWAGWGSGLVEVTDLCLVLVPCALPGGAARWAQPRGAAGDPL